MYSGTRRSILAAVITALAALPAIAYAQTPTRATAQMAAPVAEAKYVLEIEGGIGSTFVDEQKWSETISPLDDWNTTAYLGDGRLFITSVGNLRVGAEVGYTHFFWYTTSAAGYAITYRPHATRIGPVVRVALAPRIAADIGVTAYMFPDGAVAGTNASLGYFIPAGRQLSVPIKLRADAVFASSTTLVSVAATVGLSYRF
jgi:hypothetical protein